MAIDQRLTDAEVEQAKANYVQGAASDACEGIFLTSEEEALFASMDAAHLSHEERLQRVLDYSRQKRAERALAKAG